MRNLNKLKIKKTIIPTYQNKNNCYFKQKYENINLQKITEGRN